MGYLSLSCPMDCLQNASLGSLLSGQMSLVPLTSVRAWVFQVLYLVFTPHTRQSFLAYQQSPPWLEGLCPTTQQHLQHRYSTHFALLKYPDHSHLPWVNANSTKCRRNLNHGKANCIFWVLGRKMLCCSNSQSQYYFFRWEKRFRLGMGSKRKQREPIKMVRVMCRAPFR